MDIYLYAGLHVTGEVGGVYTIQFARDLMDSTPWRCLAIIQLTNSPHLYVDTTVPAREQRFYRAVHGPQNLVWIPPGTFLMGSPTTEEGRQSDEAPQTRVTFTQGFYMGKHEVTQVMICMGMCGSCARMR